jgi:hypothetical protein
MDPFKNDDTALIASIIVPALPALDLSDFVKERICLVVLSQQALFARNRSTCMQQ